MLFDKRVAYKPFEYPEITTFIDKINQTYWVHSEINFDSDLQEFHTDLNPVEQSAIINCLLAISQIEVAVKSYWGNLYKYIPKPEFNNLGMTFAECHIEGTEVLTPNGWKDFRDINIGDKVFQFNKDHSIEITHILAKTAQYYTGQVYSFDKKHLKCVVSPNHRMIYYNTADKLIEKSAEDLKIHHDYKLPEAGYKVDGFINSLSFMDRLRIAIQADGSRRYWINKNGDKINRLGNGAGAEYNIRITKHRKQKRLEWILENLDLYWSCDDINTINNEKIYCIRIDDLFDYKTFNWIDIHDKTQNWCKEFVEELLEWDGSKNQNFDPDSDIHDLGLYSNTNKNCIDIAQAVGILAGYRTYISTIHDKRKESYKTAYKLNFAEDRYRVHMSGLKKTPQNYDGMLYCVTVDSGMIITRYDNKTFIAGNSEVRHAEAYSRLLDVIGITRFKEFCQLPEIRKRIEYLNTVNQNHITDPYSFCRSMAIFTLAVENASLFSQFATILSFQKFKGIMKNVADQITYTSAEENLHANAGIWIINKVLEEYQLDNDVLYYDIKNVLLECADAEDEIIDLIFENGDLDFLSKSDLKKFFRYRINQALIKMNMPELFNIGGNPIPWFEEMVFGPKHKDFFAARPTDYSKHDVAFTGNDLF